LELRFAKKIEAPLCLCAFVPLKRNCASREDTIFPLNLSTTMEVVSLFLVVKASHLYSALTQSRFHGTRQEASNVN
jgi:hypothetical protein